MDSAKAPFAYDVYYWIGEKVTQDDALTAAYGSVELDECAFSRRVYQGDPSAAHPAPTDLGKQAVQYREAQGHESERFLCLFPHFMVFRGGKSTQWHHPSMPLTEGVRKIYRMWTTTYKVHPEFYQNGDEKRKQVISYELPFEHLELEQGGVYVYDSSTKLALYSTRASGAWERFWVGEMAMHIGYSRTGFFDNLAQFGASSYFIPKGNWR